MRVRLAIGVGFGVGLGLLVSGCGVAQLSDASQSVPQVEAGDLSAQSEPEAVTQSIHGGPHPDECVPGGAPQLCEAPRNPNRMYICHGTRFTFIPYFKLNIRTATQPTAHPLGSAHGPGQLYPDALPGSDGLDCDCNFCPPAPCTGLPDGASCSDGNICNGDETCSNEACQPGIPLDCSDGLACNGVEVCDQVAGCRPGPLPVISDGVDCTVDTCVEGMLGDPPPGYTTTHTPDDGACDDGDACNGSETCDVALDCQPGTPPDLSDGVFCTVDTCANGTISHTPSDLLCDNGAFCDGPETCDPQFDCQPSSGPVETDDGDPCTDDSCDELDDVVEHIDNGMCSLDVPACVPSVSTCGGSGSGSIVSDFQPAGPVYEPTADFCRGTFARLCDAPGGAGSAGPEQCDPGSDAVWLPTFAGGTGATAVPPPNDLPLFPPAPCVAADTEWLTPAPELYIWGRGTPAFLNGVPYFNSGSWDEPMIFYQNFVFSSARSVVGAQVTLGVLTDPNDNLRFRLVAGDTTTVAGSAPPSHTGPWLSPTELGVPSGFAATTLWLPLRDSAMPVPAHAQFYLGIEIVAGDSGDQLVVIGNNNGQGAGQGLGQPLASGVRGPNWDYSFLDEHALDMDLSLLPAVADHAYQCFCENCVDDTDCDDGDPATIDTCVAAQPVCHHDNVPDLTAPYCNGAAACDDGNPGTVDTCKPTFEGTACHHTPDTADSDGDGVADWADDCTTAAHIVWLDDFGTDASVCESQGLLPATAQGTWLATTGSPAGDASFAISATEAGMLAGGCSEGCLSTGALVDRSLHLAQVSTGDTGATYDTAVATTDHRVESPLIDTQGYTNLALVFEYIYAGVGVGASEDPHDYVDVQVLGSGGLWTSLAALAPTPVCTPGPGAAAQWTTVALPLPADMEDFASAQLAFTWSNDDDGAGTGISFAVDRLRVVGSPDPNQDGTADCGP